MWRLILLTPKRVLELLYLSCKLNIHKNSYKLIQLYFLPQTIIPIVLNFLRQVSTVTM